MTLEIAGHRVGLGSAYVMTARLLGQVAVELATGHPENIPNYAASYAKGLAAPLPRMGLDVTYRPYYGGSGLDRTLQLSRDVVSNNLVPMWAGNLLEDRPYLSWEEKAIGAGLGSLSFRAYAPRPKGLGGMKLSSKGFEMPDIMGRVPWWRQPEPTPETSPTARVPWNKR